MEFHSVVDAVRLAIEVQHGMIERNAGVPAERRIEFRIGIHLGDVVEESAWRPYGRRRQHRRAAGGRLVSRVASVSLSRRTGRFKGRLDLAVVDLGPLTQLRNIAEPIRVYSLRVGVAAQSKPAKLAEPVTPVPSKKSVRRLCRLPPPPHWWS